MSDAPTIAALYVETGGCYYGIDGVDPWDIERDARRYDGPYPVVAHPPCTRWSVLAHLVQAKCGYAIGDDRGCFAHALSCVRRFGGVLEHPAYTMAWAAHDIPPPLRAGWIRTPCGGWTCQVAQRLYGHPARKRTWLYYVGKKPPPPLLWGDGPEPVAHVGGGYSRRVRAAMEARGSCALETPHLGSKAARATPLAFRDLLISMARTCGGSPDG